MKFKYPHTDVEVAANAWEEITAEHYENMLCILPPARRHGNAFAVGEPLTHMADGRRAVHTTCIGPIDGKFYSKPYPLHAWDAKVLTKEIKLQNSKPRYCEKCGLGLATAQTTATCPRCLGV